MFAKLVYLNDICKQICNYFASFPNRIKRLEYYRNKYAIIKHENDYMAKVR